jgi:uncharacterized protein YndB with AHSA1/START domain
VNEGTIEQREGRVTFCYQRHLNHSVEVVWGAITDPAEIERWTGSRPEIELKPGGQYATYQRGSDRVVDRILRVEPPRLFEHTFWVQINPSAFVTWELRPSEGGCDLVLTHSLSLDDVRQATATVASGDDLLTILSRNGAGWHRLLDKLAAALAGRGSAWSKNDQKALRERYAALLA